MEGLQTHVDQFEDFLEATLESRAASERDRDYRDHKQWTDDEVNTLQKRKQAPVVINRVKTKVNVLSGIQRQRRSDPKALPRTPQHEDDSDSITDALRFVQDNTDFPMTSSQVFEEKITWGYAGAFVGVRPDNFEIVIEEINGDRFYYDPHSRRLDFKDARYMGIVIWMDLDEAQEAFPDKKEELENLIAIEHSDEGETFEDKPVWLDRRTKRLRVLQHYFLENGTWMETYFTRNLYLIDPRESPWHDESGQPTNPIEAETAYIDRENNRYGEIRQYIWPQQELNHRRSKALYQLSVRQSMGDKGAVEDVSEMKRQLAMPDGHVELTSPSKRFEILENNDQIAGQLELYQDAKGDIDSIGANAALSGSVESEGLSGRAIQALQQGGIAELGGLFDGHTYWERRVYRQVWARIKQFWNEERWIRVTDDEDNLRWVTLNQPVTMGEMLQEQAQQGDQMAQQMLQQLINDPRLNQVVAVKNNTTELDVDVVLTQTPDYATLRQEQFETLATLANGYGPEAVPFEVMLELSDIPHKRQVKDLLNPPEEQPDPVQVEAQQKLQGELLQLEYRDKQASVDEKEAKARKELADAEAQELENAFVRDYGLTPDDFKKSLSTGA